MTDRIEEKPDLTRPPHGNLGEKRVQIVPMGKHLALDDGKEIFFVDRGSVISSLRISRTKCDAKPESNRPEIEIYASFRALLLSTQRKEPFFVCERVPVSLADHRIGQLLADIGDWLPGALGDQGNAASRAHPFVSRAHRKSPSGRLRGLAVSAVIGVALMALGMTVYGLTSLNGNSPELAQTSARPGPVSTEHMIADGYLEESEFKLIAEAAKKYGLNFNGLDNAPRYGAKPFYVFGRLDCEDCATIDLSLPNVSKDYAPYLLPVNVAQTKLSALGVIDAYCAANPTSQWLENSAAGSAGVFQRVHGAESCTEWVEKIQGAQLAYGMAGLGDLSNGIIAPNGAVFTGNLLHIPEDQRGEAISQWLKANTNTDS